MGDPESQIISNMKIPDYLFAEKIDMHGFHPHSEIPQCPVLVFINSRSGGQLGSELIQSYRKILSPKQVFDLIEVKPDRVLHTFLTTLDKLKAIDENTAEHILSNLKIIAAGGDGTAGWLLSVVGDLKLSHPPPIATVPLGTGNNLPYSFGWGKKNPGTDIQSVEKFLVQVYHAKRMNIDSWHIVMKMTTPTGSVEPVKLPHSLHAFNKVSESDELHEVGCQTFRGGFWNYFSIGMDAQVSYEFHRQRQENPEKFKSQLINQGTYAKIGITQGWFLANATDRSSKSINKLATIEIQTKNDHVWRKLKISNSVRSIVMLNLPSFSGGLNPWGNPNHSIYKKRDFTPAFVDDGLIELVGFRNGWHGLALLVPEGHGTRLAQAHKVRMTFHKGSAKEAYMRMDGEPWLQPLPEDGSETKIVITRLRQAVMLTTGNCIAASASHEPGNVMESGQGSLCNIFGESTSPDHLEPIDSHSGDSSSEDSEARRKFGAADTFKVDS